MKELC